MTTTTVHGDDEHASSSRPETETETEDERENDFGNRRRIRNTIIITRSLFATRVGEPAASCGLPGCSDCFVEPYCVDIHAGL